MVTTSLENNLIARLAGILLLAMIVITSLFGLLQADWQGKAALVAGVCAWSAAFMLFHKTSSALKIQVVILMVTGFGLLGMVIVGGGELNLASALVANTGLLSMIAAVGFLRLVALPEEASEEQLPTGKKAFLQTVGGLNLTSSIINISAPILIGDRIHQSRPLDQLSIQSFTRVFCAASSWSPFFAAMAVVLTYVTDAELSSLLFFGIPFTLLGVLLTVLEAHFRFPRQLERFVGYPIQAGALAIPLLLVIAVGGFTLLAPETSLLVVISLCALFITLLLLLLRRGVRQAADRIHRHVISGLPQMQNELCLFLAAGVLATGISAMINSGLLGNPLTFFNAQVAGLLLLGMLLLSVIGIHPVIQISSLTGLILQLEPDPNLLAATYLFAWHLGTCASPLSGTNLVFQGRYGVPAWRIALWNLPYGLVMAILGGIWLWIASGLLE